MAKNYEKSWLNKIKNKIKQVPWFYQFLIEFAGPVLLARKSNKILFKRVKSDEIVLNIGSGTRKNKVKTINLDYFSFDGVNVVADASKLPFKTNSINAINCERVLEHISNTNELILEIERVLKPGGLIYIVVPFFQAYHPSPGDFYRWTIDGLKNDFKKFTVLDIGVRGGPASSFVWLMQEFLAIFLSFGSKFLYKLILIPMIIITFPIKYFDIFLARHPEAYNIASEFYLLGKKINS